MKSPRHPASRWTAGQFQGKLLQDVADVGFVARKIQQKRKQRLYVV